MSEKKTGGAAFAAFAIAKGVGTLAQEGMSLRDYFAAKAMQTFLIDWRGVLEERDMFSVASEAYTMADAMIAEREKE